MSPKPKPENRGGARPGAGRKPGPEEAKRGKRVMVNFTEAEYELLETAADAEGLTLAELVRERALAVEVRS
jgi:hypothetical protein